MIFFFCFERAGVFSRCSFHKIRVLLRKHKPLVLCLIKSFCDASKLDYFRLRFGFDSAFCGARDKLGLFWNTDLSVSVKSLSALSITVSCMHATIPSVFWTTFVYAKTKEHLEILSKALSL